jgi:hypothetical protein
MYTIMLDGLALHRYGQGVYGWGPVSSITGQRGTLVEFQLRSEAEDWMQARRVFCTGATVKHLSSA